MNARDLSQTGQPYTVIANAVIDDEALNLYDREVYLFLARKEWAGEGWTTTHEAIARGVGCSVSKVQRSLSTLRARHLVTWSGNPRHPLTYRVCTLPYVGAVPHTAQYDTSYRTGAVPHTVPNGAVPHTVQIDAGAVPGTDKTREVTKKDVSVDKSTDGASAPLPFSAMDTSGAVRSEEASPPAPPVTKAVPGTTQRATLHKPKQAARTAEQIAAGKAAAASYYRVFEALAAAHGETAAEAAPRREAACKQAKVALKALGEAHPDTAEGDLCDTIAWLGKKLKAHELHFLTVHYASTRVAEWRKVYAPQPEPVQKPLTAREQAYVDKLHASYLKHPAYIAEQRTLTAYRAEQAAAAALAAAR